MELKTALFLILTIIPAASYGWGMRGTTIGGEKGAMLPGALIGGLLALNSEILIVKENFFLFAALGAIGMYFGGCMTYGETLGLSMSTRPAINKKKGLQGVFLKGFLWFGIFGSVFSTGINAVCNVYPAIHLLILYIIAPLLSLIFMIKLNRPYDSYEQKYPRFYFSKRRKEFWGAMLGLMVSFLIINIINLNVFGIVFPLICAFFGGFGWVIAQEFQVYSIHYAKNSQIPLFKTLFSNKNIDSWKWMECTLGAFGGLGSAIGFIVTYKFFKNTVCVLETQSLFDVNGNKTLFILFIVWIIFIVVDMMQFFIKRPITKDVLKKQLRENIISRSEYMVKNINAVDSVPKFYDYYEKSLEPTEFILYAAVPFILMSLGSFHTAVTMSVFIIFLVMGQEVVLENEFPKTPTLILRILFFALSAGIFIYITIDNFIYNNSVSLVLTLVIYTAIYEILSLSLSVYKHILKKKKNGDNIKNSLVDFIKCKPVIIYNIYYFLCILITLKAYL